MTSAQENAVLAALSDASNKQLPTETEVKDFSSKVDEVSMLIDGLAKGTISPQYVDSKLEGGDTKVRTLGAVMPAHTGKLHQLLLL